MPPPSSRPRKSKPEKEKTKPSSSSSRSSKSKSNDAGIEAAEAAEAAFEFPKCEGDGYHDTADPAMIQKVLSSATDTDGHINVAVRIRPPNKRELEGGARNIIVHAETATTIRIDGTGKGRPTPFEYDFAIEPEASQESVFARIGVPIVMDAFHGYNSTMFAYGQTSSGKSFSMMGKLADDLTQGLSDMAGVIPRVSHLLFATSHSVPDTHEFFVEASFIEIYNEKVRDLLDPTQSELKIRESPKMGVHITGLTRKHVQSSFGVGNVLNMGFQNRTVASTRYNSESSRSHAIFELNIRQKYLDKASGEKMSSTSKINLVDLAGSERSDKVGTTGTALVEGNNINKSLTVLGRCIKALVQISKNSAGKKPKPPTKGIKGKKAAREAASGGSGPVVVPFRESVLTWYLRESLSGNSRTTMLATVSPVALNHEESMSTLRYAASAKNIKTVSSKNEDPMEAKVRSLAEEIVKLKAALEAASSGAPRKLRSPGDIDLGDMTEDERLEYLNRLESDLNLESDYSRSNRLSMHSSDGMRTVEYPLLSCLNKDEMLSHAMTVSITCSSDKLFSIGRDGGGRENDFVLNGVGIQQRHCTIGYAEGSSTEYVVSNAGRGAVVLINGQSLEELGQPALLKHMDRITLGPCRLLAVFLTEPLTAQQKAQWTYETAFAELMHRESLQWTLLSPKRRGLLDKLKEAEILFVEQANAIAMDMCTCVRFRATIILGDGVPLLRKAEATVDEVLEAGDCEVVIVCSANPADIVETREDQIRAVAIQEEKRQTEADMAALRAQQRSDPRRKIERMESELLLGEINHEEEEDFLSPTSNGADLDIENAFDDLSLYSPRDGRPLSLKEEISQMKNLTLFEMKMGQFEELLAELKVTYSYVASLSQGVSDDTDLDDNPDSYNTVQAIFDTVDCDGSGTIDRAELAAAFKLFDETAIDPDFCEHMMDDLIPDHLGVLDFDSFSAFLVKFLQHQCLHKLEPYVSNQQLFVALGGRDLVDAIAEERKKEQALELRNAELLHEISDLKRKIKKPKAPKKKSKDKKGDIDEEPDQDDGDSRFSRKNSVAIAAETAEAVEQDLEAQGMDAEGEQGVLKFLRHAGLEPFGPVLVSMGVDNVSDLLDEDLVGDDELSEAGFSSSDVDTFRQAVAKRKEQKEEFETAVAKAGNVGLEGSVHEDFDPTIIGLDSLIEVPVIIMNARSKRKLFAQAGKRPTIFETWNKGFGAGPEEHTFKDNKWWLVPQKSNNSYVIVNAHSSRKLYAKQLRPGAIWEKDVGAISADDTSPENSWNILPEADGTYTLQNASTMRRLYARIQKPGDAWTNGIGAAPGDASSTDTKWYLIPDPAALAPSPSAARSGSTTKSKNSEHKKEHKHHKEHKEHKKKRSA